MKYAVIAISGTQYKVEENQTITVDKFDPTIKSTDQVLLVVDDDKVKVGNPTVKGASVNFEVVKDFQGEKLRVSTFKAKSRYRKTRGFRAQLTDLKITKITF
ncbi:50S ribosomal protein L21 [Candidatus Shapirobacteria bacterium]|nr:50S ribosomal protein L21 [Candidatus Shapirobacteria bacterium]